VIGIIDYGVGNLLSVYNALDWVGAEAELCTDPARLSDYERLILPGVGAFRMCMDSLEESGFRQPLEEAVFEQRKPILGICVGMQIMAAHGYEDGQHDGLGWFDADVIRLEPDSVDMRVPQIGWNNVTFALESPLFASIRPGSDFYFVHSYYMEPRSKEVVIARTDYGGAITAAVQQDNIFAVQFHPEKSQDNGLLLLENFVNWTPS
jgi:glutamine amidotransferase